jgi:hypothetical protein
VKVPATELGLKPEEAMPGKMMQVLDLDPNAALKFKEFEFTHKVKGAGQSALRRLGSRPRRGPPILLRVE